MQPLFASVLGSWWGDAGTITSNEPRYLPFREYVPDAPGPSRNSTVVKLLDVVTGEVRPMTEGDWPLLRGRYWSDCSEHAYGAASPCRIWSDGRVVWEGALGWTTYLGVVEPVGGLALPGITPTEVMPEPALPDPPPRADMVGPLLVYAVRGSYGEAEPDFLPSWLSPWDVMVHDEGTGRTWRAFTHHASASGEPFLVQAVDGGIVARTVAWPGPDGPVDDARPSRMELTYFTLDGEVVTLLSEPLHRMEMRSSPDGGHVAVGMHRFIGQAGIDWSVAASIRVFSFPDGAAGPVFTNERFERPMSWFMDLGGWGTRGWNDDGAAFVVAMTAPYEYLGSALATVDGGFRMLADHPPAISPNARYAASPQPSGLRITDFETGDLLWSEETVRSPQWPSWEWASGHQFAWSSGSYRLDFRVLQREADHELGEVSVLDVETGDIEVVSVADYLARFRPAPRAGVECPEHPAQPCRVTLDREVVGEGRWPRIVGFIELD